jgi:CheY-like chemotaxis protein
MENAVPEILSPKILIVDDEPDLVETCVRLLKPLGNICLSAYDCSEAINLINAECPDLLVLDYNLPEGCGLDVLKYAREKTPKIPVIIMTAYHTSRTVQEAYDAGATAYLRKPFSTAELIKTVRYGLSTTTGHECPSH